MRGYLEADNVDFRTERKVYLWRWLMLCLCYFESERVV